MDVRYVEMLGKQISVELSNKASQQLHKLETPLVIEMELYFSCLIRKQVRVYEELSDPVVEKLEGPFSSQFAEMMHIAFRPVMTKACSVSSCEGDSPPLSDFPIKNPHSYIPKWLKLDYRKGQWCGDFGY